MWRKARANLAEMGVLSGALYTVGRAVERITGRTCLFRYSLVAQPVPDHPLLGPRRGRTIAVRLVGPGDPALAEMPLSAAVLQYRFAQDAVCFGAFQDGTMIGCLWLRLGPYIEDEVRCEFVPEGRSSWDFDVYIAPERRSGLAFARLWDEANSYLRDRGARWSFSRISAFNPRSLAAHGRMGARPVGAATYLRFGRWQLLMSRLAPYLHLSTGPQSVPRLILRNPQGGTGSAG